MCKALIKGGLLGGLIIFIWGMISWMILPWHSTTIHNFKDETAVVQVLKGNATASGVYFLPNMQQDAVKTEQVIAGPIVFASVYFETMKSMNIQMVIGLMTQILAAFLVTWMLCKTNKLSYMGRVGFVLIFALAASVVTNLPYWNWFYFPTTYSLIAIADTLIGWLLAGLAIAKVVPQEK